MYYCFVNKIFENNVYMLFKVLVEEKIIKYRIFFVRVRR